MDRIVVREARTDEAEELGALALRSKALWGYDAAFLAACRDELRVTEARVLDGGVLVAGTAEAVMGFVAVGGSPPHGVLEMLFVEPDLVRRGVGGVLLDAARAWAAARGHRDLVLDADPGAEGFYLAAGARRVGESPSGSIPGRLLPRLLVPCADR